MDGAVWIVAFGVANLPIATLLLDRLLAVPTPTVVRHAWLPGAAVLAAVLGMGWRVGHPVTELVGWGAVGGMVATVGLDVVRLIGLHVFKAFPVDMPQVFGLLVLGLGPRLQENVMAAMVRRLADADPGTRRTMLAARLVAMARLPQPVRVAVVRAMRKGLATLPDDHRAELVRTQMAVLAELPSPVRRAVMHAMDVALTDGAGPTHRQPRGMPKVPMDVARALLAEAVPQTAAEAGIPRTRVLLTGYGWHLLNGLGFGVAYTLLVGHGTWVLAVGWGLLIWAGMMVTMPLMMPTIQFPMPRFLVVPLIAHLVMAGPIGHFARYVSPAAHGASLLGPWVP